MKMEQGMTKSRQMNAALVQTLLVAVILSCGYTAKAQITLATALNTTNLTWTTGGSASWFGQTAINHDGVAAARSGAIYDSEQTWLQTSVTGPGMIAFCWKVSSEGDCDLLQFYIGATVTATISGGVDWQRVSFRVPAGSQTLKWSYSKDPGASSGLDAGFLDEVLFVPNSGAPVFLVQPPARRTVIEGLPVTLAVSLGGDQNLTYQWRLNDADVPGGTSHALNLPSVTQAQAGTYRVVATNPSGSVTSAPSLLVVTNLNAFTSALLLVDGPYASPYETALQQLSLPCQRFNDEPNFAMAVEKADPVTVCVIVDSYWAGQNLSSVLNFVNAGGRAIAQYWMLSASSPLAIGLGSPWVQPLASAAAIYDWGGSPLFTGLSSPIAFTDLFVSDGVRLNPSSVAKGVAGFTASATAYQCAIVVGNSNRTILNGFLMEEVSSSSVAAQLARNEISYLSVVSSPPKITVQPQDQTVIVGATARFSAAASGSPAPAYQWFFKDNQAIAGATDSVLRIPTVTFAQAGSYRVVVTNVYGAVTSSPALLTVLQTGPVQNTLLFVDGSQGSSFETALAQRGTPCQRYNDLASFGSALGSANPATTLAIADITFNYLDLTAMADFALVGGRAILECWNLSSGPVAEAFGVNVSQSLGAPPPLYQWSAAAYFAGLSNPVTLNNVFTYNGVTLEPISGGMALAGFAPQPAANQAAVVLANNGRTLVNGCLGEDMDSATGTQFSENEIAILAANAQPVLSLQLTGDKVVVSWPSLCLGLVLEQNSSPIEPSGWQSCGYPIIDDGTSQSVTIPTTYSSQFFRLRRP